MKLSYLQHFLDFGMLISDIPMPRVRQSILPMESVIPEPYRTNSGCVRLLLNAASIDVAQAIVFCGLPVLVPLANLCLC